MRYSTASIRLIRSIVVHNKETLVVMCNLWYVSRSSGYAGREMLSRDVHVEMYWLSFLHRA